MKKIIVGLTGASGAPLFKKLIEELINQNTEIFIVATEIGEQVFLHEVKQNFKDYIQSLNYKQLHLCDNKDFFSNISSGSYLVDGMIILPCSMGTVGKIASGTSNSLLIRACDVQLKEKRKVVIAFREAPLSTIHLNNLLTLSKAGAIIYPIVPAFYNYPQSIDDIINQMVGRILSYFDINIEKKVVWKGK